MLKILSILLLALHTSNTYAIDQFLASCISEEVAHRYESGNAKTILGDSMDTGHYGWSTEHWWGKDEIAFTGKETVTLNYGKLVLTIIQKGHDFLKAIGIDENNIYLATVDQSISVTMLTQQQLTTIGKSRQIKARTTILTCTFD